MNRLDAIIIERKLINANGIGDSVVLLADSDHEFGRENRKAIIVHIDLDTLGLMACYSSYEPGFVSVHFPQEDNLSDGRQISIN